MTKIIEIDQSIKIEQTAQDTVLAMANRVTRAIIIPAQVKRKALNNFRRRGKNRNTARYKLFAAGLFILLRPHLQDIEQNEQSVTVDTEYTGHEATIKGMLLQNIRNEGIHIHKNCIYFAQIGKSSRAHKISLQVHRKQREADHIVTFQEIMALT